MASKSKSSIRSAGKRSGAPAGDPDDSWIPPSYHGELKTRIGGNLVDGFVAGHTATDVLRELVQNEFDAGGSRVHVVFGKAALTVTGNGRAINAKGWSRLSVIIGTGRVVGEDGASPVEAKSNGIGSKNFGLRSLFLFGDRIHVGSGEDVAVLDLQKLGTGRIKDPNWSGAPGVRISVPYREERFEKLSPFTVESERETLDAMADGMLATLVKLALVGKPAGIRELVLRSDRVQRELRWTQKAQEVRSFLKGVKVVSRVGRVTDRRDGTVASAQSFEEIEFSRAIELPAEYQDAPIPNYYRRRGGKIAICVSLPIKRRRIDLGAQGHFYYPLEAPQAFSGSCMSVSAPYELNNDRTALISSDWTKWLNEQAATLAADLLRGDWIKRFGADALRAFKPSGLAVPVDFANGLASRLKTEPCWPSRRSGGADKFVKASSLLLPDAPELDGFLDDACYLDDAFASDPDISALARAAGALDFNMNSLVRLRCNGAAGAKLVTKKVDGEADFHYTDYTAGLASQDRQVKFAAALTTLSRRVSNLNREDLRNTASTLAADGLLKPAASLVRVDLEIWDVCPEPMESRLHRSLVGYGGIANLCTDFNEEAWMATAAAKAVAGKISEAERVALWQRILNEDVRIGRQALAAVRKSPVVRDHHGAWVHPIEMVQLKDSAARLLSSALSYPSDELIARPVALARLRIRQNLTGADLVAFARLVDGQATLAKRFEALLQKNTSLLTPSTVAALSEIKFLLAGDGSVAAPRDLHLDTQLNRMCLADPGALVGGSSEALYRRLRVHEHPTLARLVEILEASKSNGESPPRPDVLYPEIVAAIAREKLPKGYFADKPLLWASNAYYLPHAVLASHQAPRLFDGAVPVVRGPETLIQAYIRLGAVSRPQEYHWIAVFRWIAQNVPEGQSTPPGLRRLLLDAYRLRGVEGLPGSLDPTTRCLLARDGRLFALGDVQAGALVDDDYPILAKLLTEGGAAIAFAEISDRTRLIMSSVRLQTLTSLCGSGTPTFGQEVEQPRTIKDSYRERFLAQKDRPIFAAALHRLAGAQQRSHPGFHLVDLPTMPERLAAISRVTFLERITRDYAVGGVPAKVPVETAVREGEIGVVSPRTKLDFQQLLAQSLAEIAGATDIAIARALATAILPLILTRTAEDIRVYLDRMGISLQQSYLDDDDMPQGEDGAADMHEEIVRQMMGGLDLTGSNETNPPPPAPPPPPPAPAPPPSPPPAPYKLPDLDTVQLEVTEPNNTKLEPRAPSSGGGGGGGYGWAPRTAWEIDRDAKLGLRGEELVYLEELERVRQRGYENPEAVVIWTSRDNPGADHDIRSIDEDGNTRWLEVKSTTGMDGRFEWSRKEFEKAIRTGERYELWRVYQVGTAKPIAKCFTNVAELLGESRLILELGTLRASIEGL